MYRSISLSDTPCAATSAVIKINTNKQVIRIIGIRWLVGWENHNNCTRYRFGTPGKRQVELFSGFETVIRSETLCSTEYLNPLPEKLRLHYVKLKKGKTAWNSAQFIVVRSEAATTNLSLTWISHIHPADLVALWVRRASSLWERTPYQSVLYAKLCNLLISLPSAGKEILIWVMFYLGCQRSGGVFVICSPQTLNQEGYDTKARTRMAIDKTRWAMKVCLISNGVCCLSNRRCC